MFNKIFRGSAIALVAGLAAGCAGPMWIVPSAQTQLDPAFTAHVPQNWIVHREKNDTVVLTKDGLDLDAIALSLTPNDKAFPHLKKDAQPDMLASELAADQIAEIRQSSAIQNIEVVQNQPAEIDGHNGFLLMLTKIDAQGLKHGLLIYGLDTADGYYTVSFTAPMIHYFPKYRSAFESVADSFRIVTPAH